MKNNIKRFKCITKEIGFFKTIKMYFLYIFSRNNGYIDFLIRFFERENKDIIEKYKSEKSLQFEKKTKNIWYFWWQGEDNLPEVPKMCLNALRENCPSDYKIIVLDQTNINDYVSFPDSIMKKVNDKIITLTHFSDLLRQKLLCEHGGFWIDSTVLCPSKINKDVFSKEEFWSVKIPKNKIAEKSYGQHISKGMFAGFLLKNTCNSVLMRFVRDCNFRYWDSHNYLIEYFIQIVLMRIAYENIPVIHKEIENYKISNINLYELEKNLNNVYDETKFNNLIQNTYFFKLSWKKKYLKEINGEKTIYGYLIEKYQGEINENE